MRAHSLKLVLVPVLTLLWSGWLAPVRAQSRDAGPGSDDDIIIIEEDTPPAAPTGPPRPPLPDFSGLTHVPGLSNLDFPSPPVLPLGEFTLTVSPAEVSETPAKGGRTLFGLRADQILLGGHLGFRPSLRPLGSRLDDLVRTFTDAQAEFHAIVRPNERVVVEGRKLFFRRGKIRVEATLRTENGTLACSGIFSGMGVAA